MKPRQADIGRIILPIYKLPFQPVTLRLSLGFNAKMFGHGLEAQVLDHEAWGLSLATQGLGLAVPVLSLAPYGLVNITAL